MADTPKSATKLISRQRRVCWGWKWYIQKLVNRDKIDFATKARMLGLPASVKAPALAATGDRATYSTLEHSLMPQFTTSGSHLTCFWKCKWVGVWGTWLRFTRATELWSIWWRRPIEKLHVGDRSGIVIDCMFERGPAALPKHQPRQNIAWLTVLNKLQLADIHS